MSKYWEAACPDLAAVSQLKPPNLEIGFTCLQWNYFKRRKARLEDPTIEESEDENSDDEELASVTPTKKSIMDKTKSMAMDFIGTVQEETGIGGDVKAEVLVLKDELCVDQVTEFKDQAMDLKDKLTSIPASWNLSDEQIALIDMVSLTCWYTSEAAIVVDEIEAI